MVKAEYFSSAEVTTNSGRLPAGGMEPGESVTDCMAREVWEETGLTVESSTAFAIYSEPRFTAPTRPEAQLLTVAYRVDKWSRRVANGPRMKRMMPNGSQPTRLRSLSDLMPMYLETIEDCLTSRDHGDFVIK